MLSPGKAAALLLILMLAGCASDPDGRRARGTNWQSNDPSQPSIVPPPGFSRPTAPREAPGPAPKVQSPVKPADSTETWIPLNRWCRANGMAAPERLAPPPGPAYSLCNSNGTFVVHPGSQLAAWDDVEVRLGFQPQMINSQPYVHTLDLRKTIQPLLLGGSKLRLGRESVIIIDPGHGGENAGTKSVLGDFWEKEYTIDWARRLQAMLQTNSPWSVILTRTNDVDISLSNRVSFAEAQKAAIFVSLHFNSAAPDRAADGLETYCLTPAGMPSNLARGSDDLSLVFPNNIFDGENLQLAVQVHRAMLAVNNRDRGVRRARFPGVLRGQRCPAILVEGGYLSNLREARQIADPDYRQKLAEAVAQGLLRLMHEEDEPQTTKIP